MPTANIEYIKLRGGGEGDLMRKTKTKFGKKFKKNLLITEGKLRRVN